MARQNSFGDMLRMGRERKGLDLSAAARKLRIRPDILRAIEEGDFARMPPRGYTSNMVGAYARLVGLNPTEVTRAYRDEAHQFETGRRPMESRPGRSGDGHRSDRSSSRPGSRRTEYLDTPRSSHGSGQRSSRSSSRGSAQPQYTNLVQGRQAPGIAANLGSMLPLLVVGAVIIGLLVLVLVLAFGGDKGGSAEDTPTVPISGMPAPAGTNGDSGGNQSAEAPTVEPVAPKNALFKYTIADGQKAYIEVVVDGKTKEADTYTGPKSEEYPVTGELKFVTTAPQAVTLSVNGEEVQPAESSSAAGVYTYTVDFDDILRDWQKENGVSPSKSSDNADDKGDGTSSSEDDSAQANSKADGTADGDDAAGSDDTPEDSSSDSGN